MMKIAALLCLIASISWGQVQGQNDPKEQSRFKSDLIDSFDISIRELQSGRPDITASPKYLSLLRISSGIYYSDGTIQVSSPTSYGTSGSYSLAVNTSGGVVGSWLVVASTNPSRATAIPFTGIGPDRSYRLTWIGVQNTADAEHQLTYNGDTGTNYGHIIRRLDSAGNLNSDVNAVAARANFSFGVTHPILTAGSMFAEVNFRTLPGDNTYVKAYGHADYNTAAATTFQNAIMAGEYNGAAALSSVTLTISAGTFTGYVFLEQLIAPVQP